VNAEVGLEAGSLRTIKIVNPNTTASMTALVVQGVGSVAAATTPRTREQSHRVLRETGLAHRCTVRAIDEPVTEVADGSMHLLDTMAAQARLAMKEDAAEAISTTRLPRSSPRIPRLDSAWPRLRRWL